MLEIQNLHVSVDGKEVLKGVELSTREGEIHAVMGPNGSGKTSLAFTIMGHPSYRVEQGKIIYKGKDITHLKVDERAKLGIFLAFQYPEEIPGVPLGKFIWTVASSGKKFAEFSREFKEKMKALNIPEEFSKRELNKGFSGGEKKRTEILQMLMLNPSLVILDEIDSGLDVDSLKSVSEALIDFMSPDKTYIIITHYPRILNYIKPTHVHILFKGRIVLTGDFSLARELEELGYEKLLSRRGIQIEEEGEEEKEKIEEERKGISAKDML